MERDSFCDMEPHSIVIFRMNKSSLFEFFAIRDSRRQKDSICGNPCIIFGAYVCPGSIALNLIYLNADVFELTGWYQRVEGEGREADVDVGEYHARRSRNSQQCIRRKAKDERQKAKYAEGVFLFALCFLLCRGAELGSCQALTLLACSMHTHQQSYTQLYVVAQGCNAQCTVYSRVRECLDRHGVTEPWRFAAPSLHRSGTMHVYTKYI